MQRILSIYNWQLLPVDEQAVINSDVPGERAVRLYVNAPVAVPIYIQVADVADPILLARVEGLDEIQFNVEGSYKIFALGGEIWFYTLDGSRGDVEAVDETSFTTIMERQARNPELELIERKMQENMERRMQALMGIVGTQLAHKDAEYEALRTSLANASAETSGTDNGSVSPDPSAEHPSSSAGV